MFGILRTGALEGQQTSSSAEELLPLPLSMAPMPSGQYRSRDDLLEAAKAWAATQGYAVVIARSRTNRLWIKCDRGGTYKNRLDLTPELRKRKRGESRLLGCPFIIQSTMKKDGIWHSRTKYSEHNHGPSTDLSFHPALRKLTDDQTQKVNEMTDAGNTPAETLEELKRLWPGIKVIARDIYNARKKHKMEMEGVHEAVNRPQTQFQDPNGVFPGPTQNGRWAWVEDDEEVIAKNRLKKNKKALELKQRNSHSLSLDPQLHTGQLQARTLRQQPQESEQNSRPREIQRDYRLLKQPAAGTEANSVHVEEDDDSGQSTDAHESLITTQVDQQSTAAPDVRMPQGLSRMASSQADVPQILNPTANVTEISNPNMSYAPNASATAKPAVEGGQILMSRIERMEQEQRDQKNLLSQILGAVQGMRDNSGL